MQAVAGSVLRNLGDKGLCIAQHQIPYALISIELFQQGCGVQFYGITGNLYNILGLGCFAPAHKGIDSNHLATTDRTAFNNSAILRRNYDGNKTVYREE